MGKRKWLVEGEKLNNQTSPQARPQNKILPELRQDKNYYN